jgi:lipid A disaccharide synthetase
MRTIAYRMRSTRVSMRTKRGTLWYLETPWGAIAPHDVFGYQMRIVEYQIATHLVRIWYASVTHLILARVSNCDE